MHSLMRVSQTSKTGSLQAPSQHGWPNAPQTQVWLLVSQTFPPWQTAPGSQHGPPR
jgi:hypothetical protein